MKRRIFAVVLVLMLVTVAVCATLTDYKGLQVLDSDPTGAAGLAINNNFKYIADRLNSAQGVVVVAASDSVRPKRADYICDGTDDETQINLAIEAVKTKLGVVLLLAGRYDIETATILLREGVILQGEGSSATVIQAPDGHSLSSGTGLITLDTDSIWTGGGIKELRLLGDGGIDTEGIGEEDPTNRADLTATVDGLDETAVTTLGKFQITDCTITKCRRGVNGEGVNERFIPVRGNEFHYNTIGWYVGTHPNFGINDFRYNDVGVDGTSYDCQFVGTKFIYNRIGATRIDTFGISNSVFQGCLFGNNEDDGLRLNGNNQVSGCLFLSTSGEYTRALTLYGEKNVISGTSWVCQSVEECGWEEGCVHILHTTTYRGRQTTFAGCTFTNRYTTGTPHIFMWANTQRRWEHGAITGCTFGLYGPIVHTTNEQNRLEGLSFNGNAIQLLGNLGTDCIFYLHSTGAGLGITGNVINANGMTHGGVIEGNFTDSLMAANTFIGFSPVLHDGLTTDGETVIKSNVGLADP